MKNINRRQFVKSTATAGALTALSYSQVMGANDRINVAVIGIRGRGRSHMKGFDALDGVNVMALCDVDENVLNKESNKFGKKVKTFIDFRKLLEDKEIDVVSIASPDHWHVPMASFSILAGKDVYVEKPVSHTIAEGRYLADLAQKKGRIVQHGTQSRSIASFENAMTYLKSGELGKIRMAKAINHQLRKPIGREQDGPTPEHVHYDLWLGPAPKRPFNKNRFHYNWHWFWDYGSGDAGNDGIHQIDIARWGLGVGFPLAVTCSGGQLFYDDDHETPDTQMAIFEYKDSFIVYEMRLWTDYKLEGHDNGNIFYGDIGTLSMGRNGWRVVFKDGTPGPEEPRGHDTHFENFIKAVRDNNPDLLTANLEDAHKSASLCHMANIAMQVNRKLIFDAARMKFINDAEANTKRTKNYRTGFKLPAV